MKKPKILVIIPAYNEEENLKFVIDKVKETSLGVDLVVVNDGSTDRTEEIAKETCDKVISLPVNLGIGGAVQAGFQYALENGYDIAIQVDGDGQHNPEEMPKLIEPIINGKADIVKGSRFLEPDNKYMGPIVRKIGMILFAKFASLILKQTITDTTSGFWAINRKVLEVLSMEYPTDFPDADNLIYLGLRGYRISEIPVGINSRLSGKSSTNLAKSIYYPFKLLLSVFCTLLHSKINRRGRS